MKLDKKNDQNAVRIFEGGLYPLQLQKKKVSKAKKINVPTPGIEPGFLEPQSNVLPLN